MKRLMSVLMVLTMVVGMFACLGVQAAAADKDSLTILAVTGDTADVAALREEYGENTLIVGLDGKSAADCDLVFVNEKPEKNIEGKIWPGYELDSTFKAGEDQLVPIVFVGVDANTTADDIAEAIPENYQDNDALVVIAIGAAKAASDEILEAVDVFLTADETDEDSGAVAVSDSVIAVITVSADGAKVDTQEIITDEGEDPDDEGKDPEDEGKDPEDEGKDPEDEGKDPEDEGKDPEDEGKDPEDEGKDPEDEGKDPEDEGEENNSNTVNDDNPDENGEQNNGENNEEQNNGENNEEQNNGENNEEQNNGENNEEQNNGENNEEQNNGENNEEQNNGENNGENNEEQNNEEQNNGNNGPDRTETWSDRTQDCKITFDKTPKDVYVNFDGDYPNSKTDWRVVKTENYSVEGNALILKPAMLSAWSGWSGIIALKIDFTDGTSDEIYLNIAKESTSSPTATASASPSPTGDKSPDTGDETPIGLYVVVILVLVVALAVVIIIVMKNRKKAK